MENDTFVCCFFEKKNKCWVSDKIWDFHEGFRCIIMRKKKAGSFYMAAFSITFVFADIKFEQEVQLILIQRFLVLAWKLI